MAERNQEPLPLADRGLRRVVVFRTGHLGDTVCAIPAFRLLRRHFADADLTLLCDRPAGGKVAAWDVIQRLEIFDRIASYQSSRGLATAWELFSLIRQLQPELLVQLPQVDRTPADMARQRRFFWLAGVRNLLGFDPPACTTEWHPKEPDRLIGVLNAEGLAGEKPAYSLPIDQGALAAVRWIAAACDVDVEAPYAVFCGGGKTATQRWPLERYAQVLSRLFVEVGLRVIAVGGPDDLEAYRRLVRPGFPEIGIPETPLSLTELSELLRCAVVYVGNDTGPMHLAAAVGCPVAAVISARNKPGRWDPDVEPSLVFRHRTSCEGCRLDECVVERHRCLLNIRPGDVGRALLEFAERLLTPAAA